MLGYGLTQDRENAIGAQHQPCVDVILQVEAQQKRADRVAEQAAKSASEKAACQEQLAVAGSKAAATRRQVRLR